jgi:hypothetical protein
MSNMACSACHSPRHKKNADHGTACENCHKPGARFVFTHPEGQMCTDCHTLPVTHKMLRSDATPNCASCHFRPGVAWIARHPYPSANCKQCHARPSANHPDSSDQCSLCHTNVGGSFGFYHPSMSVPHAVGTMPCARCHPNGYTTHTCTCHKAAQEAQTR